MDEFSCRIYITDSLKAISENTSRLFGGTSVQNRYIDVIRPTTTEKIEEDPRSCEEIAHDIWDRIRRKGGNDDGLNGTGSKIDP